MITRDSSLKASKAAAQFALTADVRGRINNGFTRIDPVLVAEAHKIPVMHQKMPRLLGAYLENPEPGILVNIDRPIGMVHMTCAHEVGHHALGHGQTLDDRVEYKANDSPTKELEADQFAYSLLAPKWLVAKTLKSRGIRFDELKTPQAIYQLSLRLGISYTAMAWCLAREKVISSREVKPLTANGVLAAAKKRALLNGITLEGTQDLWVLNPADRDCILEPRPDDRFILDAPNRISAGYVWTLDEARNNGFTLLPSMQSTQSQAYTPLTSQYVVASREDVHVPDKTLALRETQPWRSPSLDDDSFSIKAQFEMLELGLSAGSRVQRVHRVANT